MKSQNSKNQGFSYYFCLMMKGSGSGSVLVTNPDADADPGGPIKYGSEKSGIFCDNLQLFDVICVM
jgi:hypothetical protein